MTFKWTQGCKGFQLGYLDNHILCVRSGPAVRLHNLDDGTYKIFQFHTHAPTTLAVHPLGTYFAVAELYETDPKVFVYQYPDLKEIILRGSGKLELRQATFSTSSYLATVSGIPDFLLSLWDFKLGVLLCQARLNGSFLSTISFCPTDWRWVVATDNRCLHVWRVETCNQITLLRCRSMILPVQSVPLGFYKEQTPERGLFPDPEKSTTRFDPVLPESAITGVGTDRQLEFLDYLDETDRVICVSQTWSSTELVLIGCKYGELLLFDPSSMVIKVLLNPLSFQGCAKDSTDRMLGELGNDVSSSYAPIPKPNNATTSNQENTESLAIPFGSFNFLLYSKHGLFCAGHDGVLRLIKLRAYKPTVPVKNSELIALHGLPPDANAELLRVSVEACRKVFTCVNPFHIGEGSSGLRITGLTVSPSYGRLTLCSRAGQLINLNIADNAGLLETSILPEKQLVTTGDSYVGLGLLGPEKKTFCATARRSGIINTWDCRTGELLGSLVIGEKCCSLAASPLIPLVAVGMQSGVLLIIDCSSPTRLRVVQSIRLYRNPLTHIGYDTNGELLTTAADDEFSIVLSGRPINHFEPLGFVAITGKVVSLTLLRHDTNRIFILVTTGESVETGATDIFFYEVHRELLYSGSHAHTDSCRSLREDSIRLMHLHFNSPMSGVCLWPPESIESRTSPRLFAADVFERKIHTFILPDEPIAKPTHSQSGHHSRVGTQSTSRQVVSSAVSFQSTSVGSSVPIVLSGFTDVISSHQHSFQQQHSLQQPSLPTQRRLSRRTRGGVGVTLRFTPGLTSVASTTEAQDSAEETPQQTSYLSPSNSISLLRGGSHVRLGRVADTNIMMVSYSDGVVELIEVAGEELNIIKTIAIHERNQVGAIVAEFCGDLNTLISCGHDGLLVCTEIPFYSGGKLVPLSPLNTDLLERSQKECKELTMLPTYQVKRRHESPTVLRTETEVDHSRHNSTRPLFGRSSTVMTVAEQSVDVTDTNASDSEALEMTPIVSEPHRPTWTEECEKDAHALEDQVYMEAREQLRGELAEIRKIINVMADENGQLPEIQRIGRQEFELDVDEQTAILEETENAVKQVREEIELSDLAKQFTWQVLKKRCWDQMEVKGRMLKAFGVQLEVCNFPLCARSQAELVRLAAVRNRRRVHMQMEQESNRMMDESAFSSSVRAIQHEELEEDEEQKVDVNRVLAGSIAIDYGGQNELCYSQMELYTREQKIYQIMLIQDNIYRIKETFNKNFNEVYAKKESGLSKIRTRLARIRKILIDIQQSSAMKSIIDPAFSPEEQPELLLTVDDSEITVDLYLSPAELAEREARRLAEEERRRREKLDNWRERGLEEMMGGVLEVRKEDELKKDIPKPAFLLIGKPVAHWTPDDRRLYAEYERKVQELNEEREKYRKFLEGDMKKMSALIDEEKTKFDEQMVVLFNDWIRAQMAVLHEELKVWRLKWMLLVEEEMFVQESDLNKMLKKTEDEETEITNTLEAAKEVLEKTQESYEILCAEDRLMEKNFRKEFPDVHGTIYDYIAKAFRRRPRRTGLTSAVPNVDSDTVDHSENMPGSTIHNPYVEKPSTRRHLLDNKTVLEDSFRDLDNDPAREGQPALDNAVWDRLCKYRRRKVEKELEVKNMALKLADINAFVQRREDELKLIRMRREALTVDLSNLLRDYQYDQTNLELQLLTKQGQVEIEVPEGQLVHDYGDALLISRERVEELNAHIITLGGSKVAHMIKNKEFKKRFYHLEWELRQMLMHYEDLQAKLADIRKFNITREVQKYLQTNDYDGLINTQIITIEQTINLMRQTHAKTMAQKSKRLHRYKVQQAEKLKAENKTGKVNLQELNVSLHETRFIHDQNRCTGTKRNECTPRYKLLLQQQRLMQLANEQARELKAIRTEIMHIKAKRSNSISY